MSDRAQCPFLKQECIADRCQLWETVKIVRPGRMVGTVDNIEAEGCVFNLLTLPMTLPPVIIPPQPKNRPLLPS